MSYTTLPAKARKDSLGFALSNKLSENYDAVLDAFRREHNDDGTHNTLGVARAVGTVRWTAGAPGSYSLEGFNSFVSLGAGHNPAVGSLILTLQSGKFTTPMRVQATAQDKLEIAKPMSIIVTVSSATSITFSLVELSSALGGTNNNTWASQNFTFAASISCERYALAPSITAPSRVLRGEFLSAEATRFNKLITNLGALRKAQALGHDSGGAHDIREMAQLAGYVTWNGTSYSVTSGGGFTSVTRNGAGDVDLNFDVRTTPYQVFVEPDFTRNTTPAGAAADTYCITAPRAAMTTTKVNFNIFKYDFTNNSWSLADTNFFASVHVTP